jgi:hypothetical protein
LFAETVLALFTAEFEHAVELARRALELAERSGFFAMNNTFTVYALYAQLSLADPDAVALLVDELGQVSESGRTLDRANYDFAASREALMIGDLVQARRLADSATVQAERLGTPVAACLHWLGRVEVLFRAGSLDEARAELAGMLPRAKKVGHILYAAALLLDAAVALAEGDERTGDRQLAEGLSLAARWGFLPMPCPAKDTLMQLLARASERGIEAAYAIDAVRRLQRGTKTEPLRADSVAPGPVRAPTRAEVPTEFSRAVRSVLRRLHETSKLAQSPLLDSRLVERRAAAHTVQAKVTALREIVQEEVSALAASARTEPMHRALLHTYVDPAPTQLLAADQALMSFGTYRRHLAAGLTEVAAALWLREQALTSASRA